MSNFDSTRTKDVSGRTQAEKKQIQLVSDLAKSLDMQHHNSSLMHEFGQAFDAPEAVSTNTSGTGTVGSAPSPARADHQHGAEVPTWIYPTLLNAWTNYGGGFAPARYCKLGSVIHVQGLVKNGTGVVFYLGVGYRPNYNYMYASVDGGNAHCRIDVGGDGNINPITGANSYISLNLSFALG